MNSEMNYTVVIGSDMEDSMREVDPHGWNRVTKDYVLRYFKYGTDAFFFDETIFRHKKETAWQFYENPFEGIDDIYILLTGNNYEYSRDERKAMWFLHDIYRVGIKYQRVHFLKMEMDERQKDTSVPRDLVIERSGYFGKTGGENSIFNAVVFVYEQAYLVTIVLKGFIAKNISQPIIDMFDYSIRLFCESHERPPKYDFISERPRIHLPWRKKLEFDTLRDVMTYTETGLSTPYASFLKDNTNIQDAFSQLEYPNILINFRVLNREFL